MKVVGVSAKSRHTGVDPGSACAVSFHGSLWHTEDLHQAVCLHFADNHRRLIESAVLSWESLLKIQRVMAVRICPAVARGWGASGRAQGLLTHRCEGGPPRTRPAIREGDWRQACLHFRPDGRSEEANRRRCR